MNQEILQLGQTEISDDGHYVRHVVDRNAENEPPGWEVGESYWRPYLVWDDWEPIPKPAATQPARSQQGSAIIVR